MRDLTRVRRRRRWRVREGVAPSSSTRVISWEKHGITMIRLITFVFVLTTASLVARPTLAQSALTHQPPANVVGCYQLTAGDWRPGVGDNSAYHTLPHFVVLDSIPVDTSGAWRITPDIDYPARRAYRGYPRWNFSKDELRLMWSNGFMVTTATLRATEHGWKGKAQAKSDYTTLRSLLRRPGASIELKRVVCT